MPVVGAKYFTSSIDFTFPPFVNKLVIDLWGGGGAGGSATSNGTVAVAGGGGGGAAAVRQIFTGSAFEAFSFSIASRQTISGFSGSNSTVRNSILSTIAEAGGGAGGGTATTSNQFPNGGVGATSYTGERRRSGGNGTQGNTVVGGSGGGGAGQDSNASGILGGSDGGGNGGGGGSNSAGSNAGSYGGGGGGAHTNLNASYNGGSGGPGYGRLTYPLNYYEEYYQSDSGIDTTFTVPANVYQIIVECWGAGGAGGFANPGDFFGAHAAASGGAGGNYARSTWSVSPGQTLYIHAAKRNIDSGTTGISSSVYLTVDNPSVRSVVATGGVGGQNANGDGRAANTPTTTGCVGDIIYIGGTGGNGDKPSRVSGAGGGAAGSAGVGGGASFSTPGTGKVEAGGNGGAGVNASTGLPGTANGGGGSGAESGAFGPTRDGGFGGRGLIKLSYVTKEVPSNFLPFMQI